ncbi:Cyclic nucleotide-binding domain-containing protein [bacterium A37T11]|nr:Cyclic nucleotide-binding domain-containing protein [bacterium A37T11]
MERFYKFWRAHYSDVRPQARSYVDGHHQLKMYRKGEVIKFPTDLFPYFCIVLEGLVGAYALSRSGRESMRELSLPLDFFTGTEHTFSRRQRPIEFRALEKTKLLLFKLDHAQEAQKLFQEVAELFQILKQRKILRLRRLIEVYQEEKAFDRYVEFATQLKELVLRVPIHFQAELLHISDGHFRKLRKRYAEER